VGGSVLGAVQLRLCPCCVVRSFGPLVLLRASCCRLPAVRWLLLGALFSGFPCCSSRSPDSRCRAFTPSALSSVYGFRALCALCLRPRFLRLLSFWSVRAVVLGVPLFLLLLVGVAVPWVGRVWLSPLWLWCVVWVWWLLFFGVAACFRASPFILLFPPSPAPYLDTCNPPRRQKQNPGVWAAPRGGVNGCRAGRTWLAHASAGGCSVPWRRIKSCAGSSSAQAAGAPAAAQRAWRCLAGCTACVGACGGTATAGPHITSASAAARRSRQGCVTCCW
jgi:hypothetical protein